MTNITLRWSGPTDAAAGSVYKIERTTDNSAWTTLAAAQAASSPYASDSTTLASNTDYGAATVALTDASAFASTGYLWLDDALVQWSGKSGNSLTGCIWHSGYGIYASGSAVYEAHESYADTVTITANAVLYRITHTDPSGIVSAPTYVWYYSPPAPASSDHCVVIVAIAADIGIMMQASIEVQAYLQNDSQFSEQAGLHLEANAVAANSAMTNAFGLVFFQCWRNSARSSIAGASDAAYTFVLNPGNRGLTVTVSDIPDRDWVLLSQVAD